MHFTYCTVENPKDDLCQGDILEPTEELRQLFRQVHRHFDDDKYVAFLVLTQTCDLVRRSGQPCKSRYINLSVVRPLRDVLLPLLDGVCERVKIGHANPEGLYLAESMGSGNRLLGRIINQNAQVEGLFYLHKDASVGLAEESVALLQVSIALRSREHYETLCKARRGRLTEPFQSKLGWLVGHLFSRVATQDVPTSLRDELITRLLSPAETGSGPLWIPKEAVAAARRANISLADLDHQQAYERISQFIPKPAADQAAERILQTITQVLTLSQEQAADIRSKLISDPSLASLLK